MSRIVKLADRFPHWPVGGENIAPSVVEDLGRGIRAECFESPARIIFSADPAGFELVLAGEQLIECASRVRVGSGKKLAERRFKIKVEKDFSDVEEEVWHGFKSQISNFKFQGGGRGKRSNLF